MATERVGDSGKGARNKKKNDKGGAGMGHNLTELRKKFEGYWGRLETLQDEMDSTMGEFRADFKELYNEIADNTGTSRKIVRSEFRRYLANKRQEEMEKELESSERDQIEMVRAALGDTPFGKYMEGKLAKLTREEKAERKAQEEAEGKDKED